MKTRFQHRILIGTLASSALLASAGTSMANIALPSISREFAISFSAVRWVVLGYLMATTIFSLVVGRLGDVKGRRNILLAGVLMFSIGTLISTFSISFSTLIIGRIVQGIGAAALAVIPIAIVTDALPNSKMGQTIGLLATMSALGTATGPSLGGFLLGTFGWRSVFAAMTVLGFFALFISFVFIQADKGKIYGDQPVGDFSESLKLFFFDHSFQTHLFSNLIISAVMISTLIIGPFYLSHALHLDPHFMGLVMSAGPITSIFAGTIAGYAVDRFGFHFVIKLGFIQSMIGTLSFVILPTWLGWPGFALSAALLSLGYQLFLSANSNSLMRSVQNTDRGVASGALNLSRNLGLIIGTYAMGALFDLFVKRWNASAGLKEAITNAFNGTFLIAAFMIAVLLLIQLKHKKRSTYEKGFIDQIY